LKLPDESLECFNNALKLSPSDEVLLNNKAFLLSSMGRYEDAILIFDELLVETENRNSVLKEKSNCLLNIERYNEALECIREVLGVVKDDPDLYFKEGTALGGLGKANDAIKSFEKREENNGRIGVFWHTQGSGKSFSRCAFLTNFKFFAKKRNLRALEMLSIFTFIVGIFF